MLAFQEGNYVAEAIAAALQRTMTEFSPERRLSADDADLMLALEDDDELLRPLLNRRWT